MLRIHCHRTTRLNQNRKTLTQIVKNKNIFTLDPIAKPILNLKKTLLLISRTMRSEQSTMLFRLLLLTAVKGKLVENVDKKIIE